MDIRAVFMGFAFAVMWSSAFTSARIIVEFAPPLMALALRFLISGLIGIMVAAIMGQSARLTRLQWRSVIIFGICQNALYLGLNFVALQKIEASLAAIIASTMPLFVALAGWVVFGQKLRLIGILGLLTGFTGAIIIMGARLSGSVDLFGVGLCIIGVISLTVATLSVISASSGGNIMMIVGLQMLVGSIVLWVAALSLETYQVFWNWKLIIAFTYTTLVPGLLATWVWFRLVHRVGTVKASTFHFLNPFLGVAIAAIFLGERVTILDFAGIAIIAAGIFAVQISKQPA